MIPEKKPDPVVLPNPVALIDEGAPMLRIPIIEEQLAVSKQRIETSRVRLVKTVREDEQTIHIPLVTEQIDVERVAIDRYVDEVPGTRLEGDTTIYSVLKEEYVLQKRLRLVEEIRISRRQVQTTDWTCNSVLEIIFRQPSGRCKNEIPVEREFGNLGLNVSAADCTRSQYTRR